MAGLLARERTIAKPGYNRWFIPPAALAIHLAIGQAYAFSVFKIPMSKLLGITQYVASGPVDLKKVPSAPGDWSQTSIAWIFSLAIVFLGLSAAVFGTWLERVGPRKAMFTSACCFAGGFFVSALGVWMHQIVLVYLGYGVLGGIGLGIGYISPVSTLIKWFPDRPGMATGLAIMGFGGGAMIGSPLAVELMKAYGGWAPNGVLPTLVTMGAIYFVFMMFGAFTVRVPAEGWKPAGFVPKAKPGGMVTTHGVTAHNAILTPQFYLLWGVLFLNVTAGIGILENASAFIQQVFPNRVTEVAASGFVGLLSIFNMGGRFLWSSFSDYLGRKMTYMVFFVLGPIMFALIPTSAHMGSIPLFVLLSGVIISMYGGGFATVPAYLRDLFGTLQVGAIHGRLLTAWSAAGIAGPALVNYIRDYQTGHGVAVGQAYNTTMYIMAGLLVLGFVCNLLVRAVNERFYAEGAEGKGPDVVPPGTAKVAVR
jgi:MFS family permease